MELSKAEVDATQIVETVGTVMQNQLKTGKCIKATLVGFRLAWTRLVFSNAGTIQDEQLVFQSYNTVRREGRWAADN